MTPDEKIFAQALDLPAAVRAEFIATACGDDEAQRQRIAALLTAFDEADDFLENSPVVRPEIPAEEKPGDQIDNFILIRKIGEGGCGVVFLAEQIKPVKRRIALKVIKLGMDTLSVIARFEAERQALARMDHADIARVYDAGSTASGRPYFVMEYVDGQPITKFADSQSLSLEARLELFARVCLALQHAHRKGIIHRDIKPSNILVSLVDGIPTPKVIDFGIAKATSGRLTEQTLLTGFDQFIGTPAYMSPEQAEQQEFDIDTRSDVYSLGVLLYELLTGRPPYDPQSLIRAGVAEIRRIIREVEPPRPSTAVSTLADADRDTIARLRRAAPTRLTSALKGDLDWIIMRCLEKNRDRRYDTAHALAEDVRRHLRREPVEARPPELTYRAHRFISRNRLACTSAAAVLLALILGTVISTRQAIRATRAETVARAERDVATAATAAEALARADAQRRQAQAEDLLTFMLGDFRTELKKIGRLNLLDAVGEQAMAYFANLDGRDLTDTALARQAKALTQIGEIRLDQARFEDAHRAFTSAYDRAAALAARNPENGDQLFERAQSEYWIGLVARGRGEFDTMREWLTHYRDSAIELAAIEGPTLRAQRELTYGHHNLAVVDFDAGRIAEARLGFTAEQQAVAALSEAYPADRELQFDLSDVASWLGFTAQFDGDYPEALARFREMSDRLAALVEAEPKVAKWQHKLAQSLNFIAEIEAITGDIPASLKSLERCRALRDALFAQDPANQYWRISQLSTQIQHVRLLMARPKLSLESQLLQETRLDLETLVAAEPTSEKFTRHLAAIWRLRGMHQFGQDPAAGMASAQRAISLIEPLIQSGRADRWAIFEYTQSHLLAAFLAHRADELATERLHAEVVLSSLPADWRDSRDYRLLVPGIQALFLIDEPDTASTLLSRLRSFGYHPSNPLTNSILIRANLRHDATSNP